MIDLFKKELALINPQLKESIENHLINEFKVPKGGKVEKVESTIIAEPDINIEKSELRDGIHYNQISAVVTVIEDNENGLKRREAYRLRSLSSVQLVYSKESGKYFIENPDEVFFITV